MTYPRVKSSVWAAAGAATLVLLIPVLFMGCDGRKSPTGASPKAVTVATDSEATALASLEAQADAARCRAVLQQLDAGNVASNRPTLSESERAALADVLGLTPVEIGEISQGTFSQLDAAYLEECLLIRAAARALRIDDRPPLERARIGFDWVCRQVYLDDRVPWPAAPWYTLESGSGIALSRAYAVLAVWQQLGLDGCLVGPPAMKSTASWKGDRQGQSILAPVRACGVQIGSDLFLFDATTGTALTSNDGKNGLTLAQVRVQPDAAKGFAADEVKTWQPFLAPALSSLSKRIEWLEQKNPANASVKLYVDVAAQRVKFGEASAGWNPSGDKHSATRVLSLYALEESTRDKPTIRDAHKLNTAPIERMPKTNLDGALGNELANAYLGYFVGLRYSANTPRDLMLHGQYKEAMSALSDLKEAVDNARTRMEQDANLKKDFTQWASELQRLSALAIRPDPSDPSGAQAKQVLQNFRNAARNRDIERAFVLGNASKPLGAEVTFLMATCVHERAERSQTPDQWKNAAEWWQRFLEASAQAQAPFPAREPHARALLARCQQFAGK
jgi:hypothetical protein